MADLLVAIVVLIMFSGFMAMVGEMLRGLGRLLSGKSGNDRTSRYPPSGIPPRGAPRLSEFRMQVVDTETESGEPFKTLQIKGLFPVDSTVDAEVAVSILDVTEDEHGAMVISLMDDFQEESTTFYSFRTELGEVSPTSGFLEWTNIAPIVPHLLVPPEGGVQI